ncbi:MAG TPA: hypothetical protein PKD54_01495 [Pirellulaceae bacterium]|nr:hypothetical protein [Pirellulaceae bacterium]
MTSRVSSHLPLEEPIKTDRAWPPPKCAIWNHSGEWLAAFQRCAPAAWSFLAVDRLQDLDKSLSDQPRAVAIVAWSEQWLTEDWIVLAELCQRVPTVVVSCESLEEWELVLRQFGAIGVFGSTLQAAQAVRLIDRHFQQATGNCWSLEEEVEMDLRWGR